MKKKISKRYKKLFSLPKEKGGISIDEAIKKVKLNCTTKFNESIDVSFNLNIKNKKDDASLRTIVNLPHGNGKKVRVAVLCEEGKVSEAKKAGADITNFDLLVKDIENGKIVIKKYFHIGIAVDTPHGLMVPKMRNVDKKNINKINNELKILSEKCRNLKIDKKEFFGGSMTITSLGGIGGSFFTPIINYPEVAILGIGKSSKKQILIDEEPQTRVMLPLSLSYDHRIIDGAEAAKFCNEIKENLGKNFAYKLAV